MQDAFFFRNLAKHFFFTVWIAFYLMFLYNDTGAKGFLTPLIPDCYVLCTPAIFKNIRNPLIFLRKMAPYLCFWRGKRSKKHVFRWLFQKTCFFCACLHIFLTGETLTSCELTFHLHQVSLHQIPGQKVLPRLLLLLSPHPMR